MPLFSIEEGPFIGDKNQSEKENESCAYGSNASLSGAIILIISVNKGHNSESIAFNYAPCLATASCHDEQVFKV